MREERDRLRAAIRALRREIARARLPVELAAAAAVAWLVFVLATAAAWLWACFGG